MHTRDNGKENNRARPTRTSATAPSRRSPAHKSATATGRSQTDFPFCVVLKFSTCLYIHYSVCLKHSNFLNRPKHTVSPTAFHKEHHGNSKGIKIQSIGTSNSDSNTVRSLNVSDQKSREFQPLCCPHIHASDDKFWNLLAE